MTRYLLVDATNITEEIVTKFEAQSLEQAVLISKEALEFRTEIHAPVDRAFLYPTTAPIRIK